MPKTLLTTVDPLLMKKFLLSLSFGLLLLGIPANSQAQAPADNPGVDAPNNVRHWTDKQGRSLHMQFLRLEGNNAVMRTPDRRIHTFPLSSLAAADQEIARQMTPISTSRSAPGDHRQSASMIDQLVENKLKENKRTPNERTTDEQFIRRIYLDAIGRTPTYEETVAFLNDETPSKRSDLIDTLLASEGYTSNLFNYMAGVLRLREGKPYDEMVYEMITATGKVWDNPAAGYLLMDSGMPNDNMANTLSIFLGTEVACAQCHDHPFHKDDWTRKGFYEMAAFYGATSTQRSYRDMEGGNPNDRIEKEVKTVLRGMGIKVDGSGEEIDPKWARVDNVLGGVVGANRYDITDRKEVTTKLPHDYQYGDGKPGEPVAPKFLTWSNIRKGDHVSVSIKKEDNPRIAFAKWLTHVDNPMFAKVIANRMWQRSFGVAVAEPIDDLFQPETNNNPKLLEYLTSEMKRVKFDLREFQRIIFNSKTYQRQVAEEPYEPGTEFLFAGPALRRLNAEQIWDSYLALVMENPEAPKGNNGTYMGRTLDMDLDSVDGQTALLKLQAYMDRNKNQMMSMEMMNEGGVEKRNGMTLMRASELPQPTPPGHFLREFGQSDRETIENANTDPAVTQVLRLMNGFVDNSIGKDPNTVLVGNVLESDGPRDSVETIYLTLLSRQPTSKELAIWMPDFNKAPKLAFTDLIWTLINSNEFIFVR